MKSCLKEIVCECIGLAWGSCLFVDFGTRGADASSSSVKAKVNLCFWLN